MQADGVLFHLHAKFEAATIKSVVLPMENLNFWEQLMPDTGIINSVPDQGSNAGALLP